MINPEKINCCGCGICAEGCPVQAIKIEPDEDGFLYPAVNLAKCINCSKCEHLCAFNNLNDAVLSKRTIVARHKSDDVCKNSTSGGMFTAISDVFLNNNGSVYSPMFNAEMYLRHECITDCKERDFSRGSKYVQSDIHLSLSKFVNDLKEKRLVAFFGTPCQISAVKSLVPNYLQNNLFTIDVVCNGVGSPLYWKQHKDKIEKKYRDSMINYIFRPKKHGYLTQSEIAIFKSCREKEILSDIDRYNVIYYNRLIMRPCCSNCRYCSSNRVSDITIADYSKAERKKLPFNVEYGVSTLLINTDKGAELFNKFRKDVEYKEVNFKAVQQVRLMQCTSFNPESVEFLNNCKVYGIDIALKKHFDFAKRVKIKLVEIYRRMIL